jgi:hypothetical protein
VVQLNNNTKNQQFIGALAIVDNVKNGGDQVFVNCLDRGNVYYSASFAAMEFIGKVKIILQI